MLDLTKFYQIALERGGITRETKLVLLPDSSCLASGPEDLVLRSWGIYSFCSPTFVFHPLLKTSLGK